MFALTDHFRTPHSILIEDEENAPVWGWECDEDGDYRIYELRYGEGLSEFLC